MHRTGTHLTDADGTAAASAAARSYFYFWRFS
jgi:hypothetical protein